MSNKKYSKEFKLDSISLVTEQKYCCAEAARSLDISSSMLSRWVREHEKDEGQAFRGNGKLTDEQLEIRRLREEVKRLTMEKDILKKATAFFAKEMK
jgi:transposase